MVKHIDGRICFSWTVRGLYVRFDEGGARADWEHVVYPTNANSLELVSGNCISLLRKKKTEQNRITKNLYRLTKQYVCM